MRALRIYRFRSARLVAGGDYESARADVAGRAVTAAEAHEIWYASHEARVRFGAPLATLEHFQAPAETAGQDR